MGILRHFQACVESKEKEDCDYSSTVSWIFSLWASKGFFIRRLEDCLTSSIMAAPKLRPALLDHLKATSTTTKTTTTKTGLRFSTGFLTRLFLAVLEEGEKGSREETEKEEEVKNRKEKEEEVKKRKEEEEEVSRLRLWTAINANLQREVGKRKKTICLSAAQLEALRSNNKNSRNGGS